MLLNSNAPGSPTFIYAQNWPRAYFPTPSNTTHSSGTFGFGWYHKLPTNGSWSPFVPIAAILDNAGAPHFFLCVNSTGTNIEVRRWGNTSTPNAWTWTSTTENPTIVNGYNSGTAYLDQLVNVPANGTYSIDSSKFTLMGTTSGNNLAANAWNYIECSYTLENTVSAAGNVKVKINRNSSDATLDLNLTSVRNSTLSTAVTNKLGLGIVWAGQTSGYPAGLPWNMYFDDLYWLDSSGSDYNTFLGRISATKVAFDSVSSTDMTATGGTAIAVVSEISDATFGTYLTGNLIGAQVTLAKTTFSSSLTPLVVQSVDHVQKDGGTTVLRTTATYSGSTTADVDSAVVVTPSTNTVVDNKKTAPDGSAWSVAKINATTFKKALA